MRQIFQGQSQIYEVIKELGRKLDEVVGRQERTMSLISQQSSGLAHGQPVVSPGQAPPPPPPGDFHISYDILSNNVKKKLTFFFLRWLWRRLYQEAWSWRNVQQSEPNYGRIEWVEVSWYLFWLFILVSKISFELFFMKLG